MQNISMKVYKVLCNDFDAYMFEIVCVCSVAYYLQLALAFSYFLFDFIYAHRLPSLPATAQMFYLLPFRIAFKIHCDRIIAVGGRCAAERCGRTENNMNLKHNIG